MSELGVLVQIAVEPGKLEELREIFNEYYPVTLQEDGLKTGHVMVDVDDPSRVFVFEIWESPEAHREHLTKAHTQKFANDIGGTYGPEGFVRNLTHFL